MLSSRQQAYLQAMDITVWNLRGSTPSAAAETALLKLGPGSGGVLLVCGADHESAGRLANDIDRSLGSTPVWAWPVDGGDEAVGLENAVGEYLFTTVAFFGEQLARRFFAGEPPANIRSAKLVVLPSMQDVQDSAAARRALWARFCSTGMIAGG
jgi:DNA polymerase III psi subunit